MYMKAKLKKIIEWVLCIFLLCVFKECDTTNRKYILKLFKLKIKGDR